MMHGRKNIKMRREVFRTSNFYFPWIINYLVGLARRREDRATYQTISRRLITAEDQFSSRSVHRGFVADDVSLVQVLSTTSRVFSCQYHSTNTPYSFIHVPPTLYDHSGWQCRYVKGYIVDAMKAFTDCKGTPPHILNIGTIWSWRFNFPARPLYPQERTPVGID
jgi:hypothetical protein